MSSEYITIRFASNEILADSDEPSRFVFEHEGNIVLNDVEGPSFDIGRFHAYYIDVMGALNEHEHIMDVFDSDGATVDYFSLYSDTLEFTEEVYEVLPERNSWEANMIIVDDLVIEPEWRGKGRGLIGLRGLIHALRPGAGIVAMEPFPYQCSFAFHDIEMRDERIRLKLDDFTREQGIATDALKGYFQLLGFGAVRGSGFMVLDPRRTFPSAMDIEQIASRR